MVPFADVSRCSNRLLDHFVGGREQFVRHGEAEHPGGRGVDDQLELGRLHDRQIGGLLALENAAGIDAELAKAAGTAYLTVRAASCWL